MPITAFGAETPSLRDYLSTDGEVLFAEGGGTSGGGDNYGIQAKSILSQVIYNVTQANGLIYQATHIEQIKEVESKIKIIMTEEDIRIKIHGQIQDSDAFSVRDGEKYYMFINRNNWDQKLTDIEQERLLHHELMVILGIEKTGDYSFTDKYREFRTQYWKFITTENNVCNIQIFEKQTGPYQHSPGQLIGSGATSISFFGSKGTMGILARLNKKEAIIFRGVIGHNGFFKMQIERASFHKKAKEMIDLSTAKLLEPMKVYSDPYEYGKTIPSVAVGENFWVIVNCNQF